MYTESDLPKTLSHDQHENPNLGNDRRINCLLWADDLVILSKSEDGLQKMLSRTENKHRQN